VGLIERLAKGLLGAIFLNAFTRNRLSHDALRIGALASSHVASQLLNGGVEMRARFMGTKSIQLMQLLLKLCDYALGVIKCRGCRKAVPQSAFPVMFPSALVRNGALYLHCEWQQSSFSPKPLGWVAQHGRKSAAAAPFYHAYAL
ncbi:MAG: hypothetical protein AAFY47_11325, partial [Pseudomonadota bacterium]